MLQCDLDAITRMPEPDRISPLQRLIDRDIDEMKNFCRDQYKLNFVELQVPDGLDNPMHYTYHFKGINEWKTFSHIILQFGYTIITKNH